MDDKHTQRYHSLGIPQWFFLQNVFTAVFTTIFSSSCLVFPFDYLSEKALPPFAGLISIFDNVILE